MVLAPVSGGVRNSTTTTVGDEDPASAHAQILAYLRSKGISNPRPDDIRNAITQLSGGQRAEPHTPLQTDAGTLRIQDLGNDPNMKTATGGPNIGQRSPSVARQVTGQSSGGNPETSAPPTSGYASATPDAFERSMAKATEPQSTYPDPAQIAAQQDPSSGGVAAGGVQTPADVLAAVATRGLDPRTMMALAGAGGAGGLGYLMSQFAKDTPVVGPNFGPGPVGPAPDPFAPTGRGPMGPFQGNPNTATPPDVINIPAAERTVSPGPYTVQTPEEAALRGVNPVNPDLLGNRRPGAVSPAELPPGAAPQVPFTPRPGGAPRVPPPPEGGYASLLRAIQQALRIGKLGLR